MIELNHSFRTSIDETDTPQIQSPCSLRTLVGEIQPTAKKDPINRRLQPLPALTKMKYYYQILSITLNRKILF